MKLFAFCGAETDWIAAKDEAEARETLKRHYGIDDDDIDGSYEEVSEVDPAELEVFMEDAGDGVYATAAEVMAGKTKPFLVCSTYQ
jgi:hypothetical protein